MVDNMKIVKSDSAFSRDAGRILTKVDSCDRQRLSVMIDSYPGNTYLAYNMGFPVGLVCSEAYYGRSRAEFCMFVMPDYRRRGIGTDLFAQIAEHSRMQGTKTLVCCLRNNSEYSGFVLKQGFIKKYSSFHMSFSGATPVIEDSFERYDDSMFFDFVKAEAKAFLPIRLKTGAEPSVIQPTENVRSFLSKASDSYYVLREDNGRIIAGAGCYRGKISDVFVDEDFRRKGIGRKLVERCIDHCRKSGFENISLTVVAENEPAVSLYSSIGFKTEKVEDYYTKNI